VCTSVRLLAVTRGGTCFDTVHQNAETSPDQWAKRQTPHDRPVEGRDVLPEHAQRQGRAGGGASHAGQPATYNHGSRSVAQSCLRVDHDRGS
jgi:hypothetical protein